MGLVGVQSSISKLVDNRETTRVSAARALPYINICLEDSEVTPIQTVSSNPTTHGALFPALAYQKNDRIRGTCEGMSASF